MAIEVKWISAFKIRFTSVETPANILMDIATLVGARLQKMIATEFKKQKTFGGALGANKSSYTSWKLKNRYSPLRGHKTGALQRAIERTRCFTVSRLSANRVELNFSDDPLRVAIPYAIFYSENKVKRNRIIGIPSSWVRTEQAFVNSTPAGRETTTRTRSIRTPASARNNRTQTTRTRSIRTPASARG